jgi:predicted DNA binding CopG/RHH family protein
MPAMAKTGNILNEINGENMTTPKVKDTHAVWDDRALGADDASVAVADASHEAALDAALGTQSISIRLPKQLIDHYKLIAHFHGVGYQPLMRDVMARWVPSALKEIFDAEQEKAEKASDKAVWVEEPRKAA